MGEVHCGVYRMGTPVAPRDTSVILLHTMIHRLMHPQPKASAFWKILDVSPVFTGLSVENLASLAINIKK